MFGTIVVPLDADEQTEYALPLAVALAGQLGDCALLLSVVPDLNELYALTGDHDTVLCAGYRRDERQKPSGT